MSGSTSTTTPNVSTSRTLPDPTAKRGRFDPRTATPEEVSAHYSKVGKVGAENRVILSGEEKAALGAAYELLARIVSRQPHKFGYHVETDGS